MTTPPSDQRPGRSDRSRWNWLLLLPVVIPLIPALYNHENPRLLGFPLFYWLQLAFIVLGVGCTAIVYRMGSRGGRDGR
ncbi:hypothetical protein GCM10009677_45450 [Sphaerisporangium rubeum]|uniref:DUF3311 domain-containing protein n=1 Tax=Sphaerisporangium rubeum TaxID=321317 RepID=A0A7X0M707_9ACTN|nr:DUF3311 domain-containing protein [Sphaerisporangium rubeum]MBB6474020.1 hypothetical protein [Sphaerisporangium rubeum]